MRVNFSGQPSDSSSNFESSVVTNVTGPLYLRGNPTSPLEASPKQYVDNILSNLSASNIKTGIIPASRLPAYTGDIISATGSGIFNLSATGVTAGTYVKLTVNLKGRVVGVGSLTNDDIPIVSWSKITTDKPTTLAGYGITDGVSVSGGILPGNLTLNKDPVDPLHAANKQYVDNLLAKGVELSTGNIIKRPVAASPSGFLRCNGGELLKTEYPALYSVIGDSFNVELTVGSGQPWRQQYAFNTSQSGDITGWTTGTSLSAVSSLGEVAVTKNRVYLIKSPGGDGVSGVLTAPINADGTLGTWASAGNIPAAMFDSQAVVTKNRVYVIGGQDNAGAKNSVFTAPINVDGTLGAWDTGPSLPVELSSFISIVVSNKIYLFGRNSGSQVSFTTVINPDGTIGTWKTYTPLPYNVSHSESVVTKNRVYSLGGYIGGNYVSNVYTAPINADGTLGAWTTGTSLPIPLSGNRVIVTSSRIYSLGGHTTGNTILSSVYVAPFSGGMNDYMSIVDTTYTSTTPDKFRLPDLSYLEDGTKYYFIKT